VYLRGVDRYSAVPADLVVEYQVEQEGRTAVSCSLPSSVNSGCTSTVHLLIAAGSEYAHCSRGKALLRRSEVIVVSRDTSASQVVRVS
jgi:hypothetical protein